MNTKKPKPKHSHRRVGSMIEQEDNPIIVLLHGAFGNGYDTFENYKTEDCGTWQKFKEYLLKRLPENGKEWKVVALKYHNNLGSGATRLEVQLPLLIGLFTQHVRNKRFILVGHSQGALLGRALLQELDNHNCQKFISLAGPHMGVFGLGFLTKFLEEADENDVEGDEKKEGKLPEGKLFEVIIALDKTISSLEAEVEVEVEKDDVKSLVKASNLWEREDFEAFLNDKFSKFSEGVEDRVVTFIQDFLKDGGDAAVREWREKHDELIKDASPQGKTDLDEKLLKEEDFVKPCACDCKKIAEHVKKVVRQRLLRRLKWLLRWVTRIVYGKNPVGKYFTIHDLWRDAFSYNNYVRNNKFLAKYNCQLEKESEVKRYRKNFMRIKKVYLFGGKDKDWVIEPNESALFGFYRNFGIDYVPCTDCIVTIKEQDIYYHLGMDRMSDRVVVNELVPDITHWCWTKDEACFSRVFDAIKDGMGMWKLVMNKPKE